MEIYTYRKPVVSKVRHDEHNAVSFPYCQITRHYVVFAPETKYLLEH